MLSRILVWTGALSGAVNLALTFVFIGMYAVAGKESLACCFAFITVLFTFVPLMCMTRYDFDLEPIKSPSHTVKTFVRFTTLGLILLAVTSIFLGLTDKLGQSIGPYGILLGLSLLGSWVCLTCYVYGIRVLYSEKVLALSRNPRFLFQRESLRRYLEEKRKEEHRRPGDDLFDDHRP